MSHARYIVGDVLTVLGSLPEGSVDCVITSPPYFRQRSYLPEDHADKLCELGQEDTPGEFLDALLVVMDHLWPVMSDDATFWINLGDKHAGSGGSGGDAMEGGWRHGLPPVGKVPGARLRDGRRRDKALTPDYGHTRKTVEGWPMEQSVCWTPQLFGSSLAYGRNLLTGTEHRQWVTRPPVTWCKPNPMTGSLTRTFRTGTELVIYGGKHQKHYFDLDAVRYDPPPENERKTWNQVGPKQRMATDRSDGRTGHARFTQRTVNPKGAPPLNWWVVGSGSGYDGAHFATYPPELLIRPVLAGCPEGGTILDPFAGSGTTLAVATGHGRDAIGIDLDSRNADLARERVGMFLTVEIPERVA